MAWRILESSTKTDDWLLASSEGCDPKKKRTLVCPLGNFNLFCVEKAQKLRLKLFFSARFT